MLKKESISFNGRLGWITVSCKECGLDYDIQDVSSETMHPAALHVTRFDCPKGNQCEARRVRNNYDDCLPDEWRDIVKSWGWGLDETDGGSETYYLPEDDYYVHIYLLPTDAPHWLITSVRQPVTKTIAMGNTGSALRNAITEELRLFRARQDFATAVFFPGKPVEHQKEPNEQDRNMLGHLGVSWQEKE